MSFIRANNNVDVVLITKLPSGWHVFLKHVRVYYYVWSPPPPPTKSMSVLRDVFSHRETGKRVARYISRRVQLTVVITNNVLVEGVSKIGFFDFQKWFR